MGRPDQATSTGRSSRWPGFLQAYYWATPLFFLADFLLGMSIRAAALPGLPARGAYYVFCLACAVFIRVRPSATAWVGMIESAVNIFLLILSIYLPMLTALDMAEAGGAEFPGLSAPRVVNLLLSGFTLYRGFLLNQSLAAPARRQP